MAILRRVGFFLLLNCLLWTGTASCQSTPDKFKVLVVLSYGAEFSWTHKILSQLEQTLGSSCELHYFYFHTITAPERLQTEAAEAFALYRQLQPNGVIAVDDSAQANFVVPYLKNSVATPVIFCGVNEALDLYGYPATNVSGVHSQLFLEESLALSRQLAGALTSFAVMTTDNPLAALFYAQILREHPEMAKHMVAFETPLTLSEAVSTAKDLHNRADALFLISLNGLTDENGHQIKGQDAIAATVDAFDKPTFSIFSFIIEEGALSGVVSSIEEEVRLAGDMLLKAMRGTPMDQLSVTQNYRGYRMINVSTLKKLGIQPDPLVLRGAELVRTQ